MALVFDSFFRKKSIGLYVAVILHGLFTVLVVANGLLDPGDIAGDAGVDAGVMSFGTVQSTHHNSVYATIADCRSPRITLKFRLRLNLKNIETPAPRAAGVNPAIQTKDTKLSPV